MPLLLLVVVVVVVVVLLLLLVLLEVVVLVVWADNAKPVQLQPGCLQLRLEHRLALQWRWCAQRGETKKEERAGGEVRGQKRGWKKL